jgi:hypothetical protein
MAEHVRLRLAAVGQVLLKALELMFGGHARPSLCANVRRYP